MTIYLNSAINYFMLTNLLIFVGGCLVGLIAGFTIGFTHATDKFDKHVNKKHKS